MNKIIPILSVVILSSCSTEQVNSSTAFSTPNPVATTSAISTSPDYQRKPYTRLKFIKTATPEYEFKEENLVSPISTYLKQGRASWYGAEFHGKKTSTGEIFDMYAMTAAHKTLPLSSYAQVTNLKNHRSVVVRINDRGPFHGNRVMDLSYAAAKELDITKAGTGTVEIKAISPGQALKQTVDRQEKPVYLQVGAFGNPEKALALKDIIEANNLPQPIIFRSKHRHSSRYKVQIGPIKDANSAEELNQKLVRLGITDTQVITEIK